MTTRREFITAAAASAALASEPPAQAVEARAWYRRTVRWGQTNITEKDPIRYDIPWWREFWKRTQVQGVILNAGGIVAYYPSKYPAAAPRRIPGRPRSLRRPRQGRPRRRSRRRRAHGFQPHQRRLLQGPSGLVRARYRAQPVPRRRQVRHLRQQPLLRRVPSRRTH